jgi:CRP/FNR family transcriptional regulator, cyclic AMP receptor protein
VKAGPAAEVVVTQTDLANMVGGSRQSVNQVLPSFARLGYLELAGGRIVIKKPDLLHQRAGQFGRLRQ